MISWEEFSRKMKGCLQTIQMIGLNGEEYFPSGLAEIFFLKDYVFPVLHISLQPLLKCRNSYANFVTLGNGQRFGSGTKMVH